jgi:peptidoglycan/LPS O-acetylase OafA/YrhL
VSPLAAPPAAGAGGGHDTQARLAQIPALDGIRGLAIIWVVLHNSSDMAIAPARGLAHLFVLLTHPGWLGVQLFFALSGYLITAGLLAMRGAPNYFSAFYARRALRILPLYYTVLLALLVVVPLLMRPPPFATDGQASLWLFTANMAPELPYGFGHFWSLSVEEQFYLVWPLVVFRLPPRRLLVACLGIAAGALLVRVALVACGESSWTLYYSTACRMDALGLGAAGACLVRLPALRDWLGSRLRSVGLWVLALFVVGIPLTRAYDRGSIAVETLGYTLLAVYSAAFVTIAALASGGRGSRLAALLSWRPLRSCGRYSYAMYVFHGLLHKLIGEPWLHRHYGPVPAVTVALLYSLSILAVSYVLGLVSYHAFEKHFLRMKRWFVPRGTTAAV